MGSRFLMRETQKWGIAVVPPPLLKWFQAGVWQAVVRGLRVGGDGGQMLGAALPRLHRLRILDLRGTRIGDKGINCS